jgi:hypothetical protein
VRGVVRDGRRAGDGDAGAVVGAQQEAAAEVGGHRGHGLVAGGGADQGLELAHRAGGGEVEVGAALAHAGDEAEQRVEMGLSGGRGHGALLGRSPRGG